LRANGFKEKAPGRNYKTQVWLMFPEHLVTVGELEISEKDLPQGSQWYCALGQVPLTFPMEKRDKTASLNYTGGRPSPPLPVLNVNKVRETFFGGLSKKV
jgi:hypothetical protein